VANRSRSPGSIGRAWRTRAFVFLAVLLRWQELWLGRRLKPDISNKAVFPSLWRLGALMPYRNTGWSQVKLFVRSPWWWLGGGCRSVEASFNKRLLSVFRCSGCVLLLLLPFSGHGGADWVWETAPLLAGLEEIGEIHWIPSTSKLEAPLPQLSLADMAAVFQPPTRRPLSILLRKLDGASPPSGLAPGGLVMAVSRRLTPEGSQRDARSRSSAATRGRRRSVAETPRSSIASIKLVVGCFLWNASPFL
jgi:hypothetical protein